METFLFTLFAIGAAGGAVAVVLSQSVVRMAFYLVIALGSTAGLFFMLGADFVGATQLLIYVGGTVVLLIFGVMLTASGPYLSMKTSSGDVIQAVIVGGAFLAMLIMVVVLRVDWDGNAAKIEAAYGESTPYETGYNVASEGNTSRSLGLAFLGTRVDRDLGRPDEELSTGYLLPFEIISVHLLVVLVGASYLARAKRRVTRVEDV
jgi:NADH-quinone oxidoreductase subunit J